jgi:hypothetical protein
MKAAAILLNLFLADPKIEDVDQLVNAPVIL